MYKYDKKLKEIKPKDLLFVILYGGLISILLGYVIGFLDYYISKTISFSFMMILFFFSSQFVGNVVRKQYVVPHVVYTVLTGIFLTLQVIIILGVKFALMAVTDISVIFNVNLYFYYAYYFVYSLFNHFSLDYLLMVLVIVVGIYVGIRRTY